MERMSWLGKVYRRSGNTLFARIPMNNFERVMENACKKTEGRISSISARDTGRHIEVLYTFILEHHILNVKLELSRQDPRIPTITSLFPGAALYEKENHEMFGIVFEGNPDLKGILLDEGSPRTPLRKKTPSREERHE
jgi:NADH:ubiquinone oxidoreductase subunit C